MKVNIIKSARDEALASFIEKHVRLAVDQFENRVTSLDVRIVDIHAGDEQRCVILAHLAPRGQVHVEAASDSVHSAVVQASRRLSAAVTKHVDRGHQAQSVRHQRAARHATGDQEAST